jgi:hypothetical protein
MGPNTSTVVSVPAMSGPETSLAARCAAARIGMPSSRYRSVASVTTMALSTSRPTPSASPPSDRMLMLTSRSWSRVSATNTDSGTISPMASELRQSRRNIRMTISDSAPPAKISWARLESASVTNSACAATTLILTSGNSPTRSSMVR